jgi:hypothetical protein
MPCQLLAADFMYLQKISKTPPSSHIPFIIIIMKQFNILRSPQLTTMIR